LRRHALFIAAADAIILRIRWMVFVSAVCFTYFVCFRLFRLQRGFHARASGSRQRQRRCASAYYAADAPLRARVPRAMIFARRLLIIYVRAALQCACRAMPPQHSPAYAASVIAIDIDFAIFAIDFRRFSLR